MSKETVLDLINLGDDYLIEYFNNVGLDEFRTILRLALKEQDRDTRHACAEAIEAMEECHVWRNTKGDSEVTINEHQAISTIMNCRGGLPEGF